MKTYVVALVISFMSVFESGDSFPSAQLHILVPNGIEFEVPDVPGLQEVGFHYNINKALSGTVGAEHNYEVTTKSDDGFWHHRDTRVTVSPGDTVNYYLYYKINGIGQVKTDMSWTAGSSATSSTSSSAATSAPSSGSNHQNGGGINPLPHTGSDGLHLIFEDDFSGGFDRTKWKYEISAFGGGNWEFQIYSPEQANTYVRDGVLYIKPTLTSEKFGESFLTTGILDVAREWGTCTKSEFYGCLRNSKDAIIPPIMSGKVVSSKSFKYGRVEVEAKMPIGDWIWPAIWLMPDREVYGSWPRSGEIDMVETRGNLDYGDLGIQTMMSTLHWGPAWNHDQWGLTTQKKRMSSGNWGTDFHTYAMDWDSSHIILSVDGQPVLSAPTPAGGYWQKGGFSGNNIWNSGGQDAPFDQEFYLQMNVAVGGTNGFFPDNIHNGRYSKPWSNSDPKAPAAFWNSRHSWLPTWKGEDAALKVRAVRIYNRD